MLETIPKSDPMRARAKRRRKYLALANRLAKEADVYVKYHADADGGYALPGLAVICVPYPSTPRRLWIFAHECAHVQLKHGKGNRKPRYLKEFEAEMWAKDALTRLGVRLTPTLIASSQQRIAYCIDRAISNGARTLDRDALSWSVAFHSAMTKRWIAMHQAARRARGAC